LSNEDRKFQIELARIVMKSGKQDAVAAALIVCGIGVGAVIMTIGLLNDPLKVIQFGFLFIIMALMIGLGFILEYMNKKKVEARISELERIEPFQQETIKPTTTKNFRADIQDLLKPSRRKFKDLE